MSFVRWARTWRIWRHFRNYFPARIIKTADLDPNKSYVIGYHPHGIIAIGCFLAFGTTACSVGKIFAGITWKIATLPVQFLLPGTRWRMHTQQCFSQEKCQTYYIFFQGVHIVVRLRLVQQVVAGRAPGVNCKSRKELL